MECPKCGFENRSEARFCKKCGTKLELMCPSCESPLEPDSAFCDKCGHNLTQPSTPKELTSEEKLAKVQKYLPKGLSEKILSQRDRIEGERKQVTVMFCDMEGFTPLVEKIGADQAYVIMDQVYELLIHCVHDFEGTVNEMTGDGIMALFGAPIALEDAPQRAIRSALAIHREMARFNDRLKQKKKDIPQLRMRIGIHSGPVVVGTLGNDLRVEFKAVGDTVNLASRMEHLAESGTTYITENTFKLTEGLFRFEALGTKKIKGKEEPVIVYQVIATSSRRTRFDVNAERGLTPLVGRNRELEILLDGFEMVKSGRGQAFSIVAEAGTGKSRLFYEFRKTIANENVTILEGKCLSYARNVAYHPIIDILKANFRIDDGDEDSVIREKVLSSLHAIRIDEESTLPYLLDLLAVKESGIKQLNITPELKRDRIVDSLQKIVVKGSEQRPLIMIFEDLHWVDKTTENVLKELLDTIPGSRVLLLFSYRPEYVHTWGSKSYHSQVNLNRLSTRNSLSMLYHIFESDEIERDLEDLVLAKTEGIPFYLEEFLKSWKDLNIIEKRDKISLAGNMQDLSIPSSIQDVIMARVDALPEEAREVLQIGSVIEREFNFGLIKHLMNYSDGDLIDLLLILKDSELLYERGILPNAVYIFKHALTRDVIYGSILRNRRKTLHEKVGNTIEVLFSENIGEYYEILLEHFIKCDNNEKGVKYSRLAENKAEKLGSLTDAISHVLRGLECIENLPKTEDTQKEIHARRTRLGLYDFQLFHFSKAKRYVEPIVDEVLSKNLDKTTARVWAILGAYELWIEENSKKAIDYLERSLNIAKEVHDIPSVFFTNSWLGYLHMYNCEFRIGLNHYNAALEINIAAKTPWGIPVSYAVISELYNLSGNNIKGFSASEKALQTANESDDLYSKSVANAHHGLSNYLMGIYEEATKLSSQAEDYSARIGFNMVTGFSCRTMADVFIELGNYRDARDYYEKAKYYFKKENFRSLSIVCEVGLLLSKVLLGEEDIDIAVISKFINANNHKIFEGPLKRQVAELLVNLNTTEAANAEQWVLDAIRVNEEHEMIWELGKSYLVYSEILMLREKYPEAKEAITQSISTFKKCGSNGYVLIAEKKQEQVISQYQREIHNSITG